MSNPLALETSRFSRDQRRDLCRLARGAAPSKRLTREQRDEFLSTIEAATGGDFERAVAWTEPRRRTLREIRRVDRAMGAALSSRTKSMGGGA